MYGTVNLIFYRLGKSRLEEDVPKNCTDETDNIGGVVDLPAAPSSICTHEAKEHCDDDPVQSNKPYGFIDAQLLVHEQDDDEQGCYECGGVADEECLVAAGVVFLQNRVAHFGFSLPPEATWWIQPSPICDGNCKGREQHQDLPQFIFVLKCAGIFALHLGVIALLGQHRRQHRIFGDDKGRERYGDVGEDGTDQ